MDLLQTLRKPAWMLTRRQSIIGATETRHGLREFKGMAALSQAAGACVATCAKPARRP
jgi:hypothetical protein